MDPSGTPSSSNGTGNVFPRCVLDRSILNEETMGSMENAGLSLFAPLCGKNRGAFVLDPPDGNTYSCLALPSSFAEEAGVNFTAHPDMTLGDANSIVNQLAAKNITSDNAVEMLDLLTQAVYQSSASNDVTPFGCDVGGLAELECSAVAPSVMTLGNGAIAPIRSVTLAGLFVPALWATNGSPLSLEEAKVEYTKKDFKKMKSYGINSVQIPVPLGAFATNGTTLDDGETVMDVLGDVLDLVDHAGLQAIIKLDNSTVAIDDMPDATFNAAVFVGSITAVVGLMLPSTHHDVLTEARRGGATLPLLLPVSMGDLPSLKDLAKGDGNVFAALDLSHANSVADVASSASLDDRMKLFYHEAVSCINRSPIEYAACYQKMPVFVSQGFDLSIDDCIHEGLDDGYDFLDYGQCGRFDETIGSGWWEAHRASFAERQLASYERGLGWSFAAWKLHNGNSTLDEDDGTLDSPAKLLSFSDVAASGLMPSLKHTTKPVVCLNPPATDFVLGDDTLPPTPSPPPDCGNGWWNATTDKCDYWVPPPPPPKCLGIANDNSMSTTKAVGGGAIAGALLSGIMFALFGKKKRTGYEQLPN